MEMAPSPVSLVRPGTELVAELGYDSLGILELMAALEDVLDLAPIEAEVIAGLVRVADVENLAEERAPRGRTRA